MERLLIVNADDFGLAESLNNGIIHAHREGILTSATLIPAAPASDHAIDLSRSISALGVGIHLNLTTGSPISKEKSVSPLTDQNRRFHRSAARLALLSAIDLRIRSAIEIELAAQIQWVLDHGLQPLGEVIEGHRQEQRRDNRIIGVRVGEPDNLVALADRARELPRTSSSPDRTGLRVKTRNDG